MKVRKFFAAQCAKCVCQMPRINTSKGFRKLSEQEFEKFFIGGLQPIPESGCFIWEGNTTKAGYGVMCKKYLHRYAYERAFGAIPNGKHVLHRCDVPCCCNPKHLFLGTQIDNNNDRQNKGRARGGSMKGEEHPMHKFTASQISEIRMRYENGERQTSIAKAFNTSQGYISNIILGKNWKNNA